MSAATHPDRVLAAQVNPDTDEWFLVAEEASDVVMGKAVLADQCNHCGGTDWIVGAARGTVGLIHDPAGDEAGCDAFWRIVWHDAEDVIFP